MSKQPKKNVQEVVVKEMPEFADSCAGLSNQELNDRLAQLAKDVEETEQAKEQDEALAEAQGNSLLLSAPYREAKKAIRLKSRYLIALLKDRGAA